MKKIGILLIITALLSGCEWLEENVPEGLTEEEVIQGLKTALIVGTDSSSTVLSLTNGYYLDEIVKIPLPDDALEVKNKIDDILSLAPSLSSYLSLDTQFENVVKSINRAAEDAAKEAAPIFKDAITALSISDGWEILNGRVPLDNMKNADFDSTAATKYLINTTFSPLTDLYAPKIDLALDKDLGLGFSANEAWDALRTSYNNAVNTIDGNFVASAALQLTGYTLEALETESIGVFATEKALDGLFYKVGEEEKDIRRDPFQWAIDILQKVFGSVTGQTGQ